MNRSIAILLLGLSLSGCVEARSVVPADGPGPLLVAHRAGTADYPENTLLAIRKALDNGADALWLSVQLSADGHPVLYRPADPVAGELERQKAWSRVRFYSTEKAANDYLTQRYADRARQFESRDATRNRLVGLAFGERCEAPPAGGTWMGIELRRELTVTERFTLGESSYKVPAAQLWTRKAMDCVRREPVKVVMFGIETAEDYRTARALGADAVMSNSPMKMEAIRRRVLADQPGG